MGAEALYNLGCPGLSKREWFAGQALAGLLARPGMALETATEWAVEVADAFIAALAKPTAPGGDTHA